MNRIHLYPYRAHLVTEFLDLITALQHTDSYISDDEQTRELMYTIDNGYELVMIHDSFAIFHKKNESTERVK